MNNVIKINLQKYCIEKLNIEAPILATIPDQKTQELQLLNNIQISEKNENNCFRVSIQSDIKFPKLPDYSINCKITGDFVFTAPCSEKESNKLMTQTAPSVIFGIIRDTILNLSTRTPYFPITLPIIDFKQTPIEDK